ncbi:SUKH-4 family immunity protein [Streptomyces sp. Ag109_G2-15]|uniref:SUKH-4 family immunity protein n=1 Tax=Streptomyces sp. Ag109_G2-15 TaxID=1938850 RepID=UPI000BDCC5DD|nr:SUKH-4 family immunity protein [Streptomyces sp. Ag109_G2-15]SOD84661.1 SUKH-4 immunity protein [Streptomyces sp. Ag109_G2-15]
MNFAVTPTDMIAAYGLADVVYFPQSPAGESGDARALTLLSSVGLPHSEVFTSKEDPEDPYEPGFDPTVIGSRFDHYGFSCPEESRTWWVLGYLFTSLIALDPESGKVYAFPESEEQYILLHRDVESLLFSLIEFRKLEVDHDNDVDPEELAERFRQVVGAFDPTPFADEESQWNLSLEELENGLW